MTITNTEKNSLTKSASSQGGLAIWRGDEYFLNFLFANRLQVQPTEY